MKKHLFRVKQLADQTFLGADKSERLNHEELQEADHKVEFLRNAINAVSKRIPPVTSNTQGDQTQQDKRMKKFPEYILGQVMIEQGYKESKVKEHSDRCDDLKLLQPILQKCGKAQQDLARVQADLEIQVEQMVSSPLQNVLENDLPIIRQQKKNLSKLILDKDSATSRYTAHKNGTQKDALRDEMEEADTKVEQCRDVLAADMFNLIKRESEFAQYMLQILKLQRAYHEDALKNLENVIPHLEKEIGDSSVKTVYGCSLREHLRVTGRKIAYPLELCVCALNELGMSEEGLFRVAGGVARVRRLKLSIDSGCFGLPLLMEYRDVHVIANALKSYLRELPEPLLMNLHYNDWLNAVKQSTEEQRLKAIQDTLKKLPQENRDNLSYLVHFLARLSKTPNNKMTPQNIAIVFAPNLLWQDNQSSDMDMSTCSIVNMIVEMFITKVERLFPEEPPIYLTIKKGEITDMGEEFARPAVKALNNLDAHMQHMSSADLMTQSAICENSPRPNVRKKNKPAPIPPIVASSKADNNGGDNGRIRDKNIVHQQHQDFVAAESEYKRRSIDGDSNANLDGRLERGNSIKMTANNESKPQRNSAADLIPLLPQDETASTTTSTASTTSSAALHQHHQQPDFHVAQSKHIQRITAQNTNVERITITSDNVQQKSNVNITTVGGNGGNGGGSSGNSSNGGNGIPAAMTRSAQEIPIPAPRVSLSDSNKSLNTAGVSAAATPVKRTPSLSESVQLRRGSREDIVSDRPKPAIPERPASLQKTQCSMGNVASKQTASLVQLRSSGHDTQMAEKEKFLGHHPPQQQPPPPPPPPQQQNQQQVGDVNSNCQDNSRYRTQSVGKKPERPPKPEQIQLTTNGNFNKITSHHVRTRSDGNLIDIGQMEERGSPTSPRCTTKPQQPPPPPPTIIRNSADSTDL